MNNEQMELSPWVLTKVASDDVIRLKVGKNIIGRAPSSDIMLDSTFISRRHCLLEISGNRVFLTDFSSNGVFVNTTAYLNSEKELKDGDRVGFGCEANDIMCHRENYPVYYLKYKPIRNYAEDNNNDGEVSRSPLEEAEQNLNDDKKEEAIDNENVKIPAAAALPLHNEAQKPKESVSVKSKTLLTDIDNDKVEVQLEQKNDENSNVDKSKPSTNVLGPTVKLKSDVIVISDDDEDDVTVNGNNSKSNTKATSDVLGEIEIFDSDDEMNADTNVNQKKSSENDLKLNKDNVTASCSTSKEESSTNLISKQVKLNTKKLIDESLDNVNSVNSKSTFEPIAGPSGYKNTKDGSTKVREQIKLDLPEIVAHLNEVNADKQKAENETIDIKDDNVAGDGEQQNKIQNNELKLKVKDEPIDIDDEEDENENEESIDMKLSQSFNRNFKQEYSDFDCEELIVLDDDDDDGAKNKNDDENDQLHAELATNDNKKGSESNEEIKSPKSSENEEEDDLADKNLFNWAQKLKIIESEASHHSHDDKSKGEDCKDLELKTKECELERYKTEHQHQQNDSDHKQRKIPEIIQPPSLPTKKGKLRGVSAISPSIIKIKEKVDKNLKKIKNKLKCHEQEVDLRKKWFQKPSLEAREQKEKKKELKETRKEKLKRIAEEQQTNKRKLNKESDDDVKVVKRPKVKVTQQNRGVFLTLPQTSSNTFENALQKVEIEYIKPKPSAKKTNTTVVKRLNNNGEQSTSKSILIRRNSVHDINHSYTSEKKNLLARCNSVLDDKNLKSDDYKRERRNSFSAVKEGSKPSKLSFSTIQYNFQIRNNFKSILKIPGTLKKAKSLRVRFNNQPNILHYEIEKDSRIEMKVNSKVKDAPAPKDIPKFLQYNQTKQQHHQIPLVDHFDKILFEVLSWKPEWLETRKHEIVESSQLCPIVHAFSSFEEFKRILFPLMKLELWASIEQDFINHQVLPFEILKISNSYFDQKKQLVVIECLYYPTKDTRDRIPLNVADLAIIKIGESFFAEQFFAFIRVVRKMSHHNTYFEIVLESNNNQVLRKRLGEVKELKIKPISQIRAEIGPFNAIYSLQYSPLLKNILNPFENCKTKPVDTEKLRYKGCDPLNQHQQDILLKTYIRNIDANKSNISLIEGPPGTGKSRVITNLAMQFLYGSEVSLRGKKILICSQSNTAIDVICNKLLEIRSKMKSDKFHLVRFGILDRMHKNVQSISVQRLVQQYLKQHQNKINMNPLNGEKIILENKIAELRKTNMRDSVNSDQLQELKQRLQMIERLQKNCIPPEIEKSHYGQFVEGANIVCTTLCSAMKLLQHTRYFDVCIIDEATQCTEQLSLIPLQFGISSLILVGDTQQLPATVLSKEAKMLGLGRSLFTRIQSCIENQSNDCILKLNEQYRMHPDISYWPNKYFYNGRLKNAESIKITKLPVLPYAVFNLAYNQNANDKTGKISNTLEAKFVVDLIKSLSDTLPPKKYQYGVITPYSEHRENLIKRIREEGFNEVLVNTIDSYQGKEKDVIIISTARTRGVGFLAHPQRLNVALTRARKCLILCGNFSTVERIPAWKSLLDDAKERDRFFRISDADTMDIENKVICHLKT